MPHQMRKAIDQFRASTAHLAQRFMAKKSDTSSKVAELYLYDVIGQDWFGGVTAKDVAAALAGVKDADTLNIYLNSPGGDVFEGHAIYNIIRRFDGQKNVYVDGLAASIASVIALAGDKVYTAENAMWMVHNPWTYAVGNADDLRKRADDLSKAQGVMLDLYGRETGLSAARLKDLCDAETWMDAGEALANGFTDEVLVEASAKEPAEDPCKCAGACDGCHGDGEMCSTECSCDCTNKAKAQLAHPVLAQYRNTPKKLREGVTARAKIADVGRRLQSLQKRASPQK